jgi:hypothetical protein
MQGFHLAGYGDNEFSGIIPGKPYTLAHPPAACDGAEGG